MNTSSGRDEVTDRLQVITTMLYLGVPNVADFVVGSVLMNLLLVCLNAGSPVTLARSHV